MKTRFMHASPLAKALNLPRTRLFGLLGILAAILALMIALLGSSGAMLQQLYTAWDLTQRNSILVYLPPTTPTEALTPIHTRFAENPAIASARIVPPTEVAAALTPVFPEATLASGTIPLPIVAEIELKQGQPREAMLALLHETFPLAELDDQQPMVEAVAQSVRLLQSAGLAIALGLGVVMALFMALTIRAGLLAQQTSVELLIQLGATDAALARTMALQAAQPVAVGAVVGVGLAALGLKGIAWYGGFALTFSAWAMVAVPLLVLPLLAMMVAVMVAGRLLHHA